MSAPTGQRIERVPDMEAQRRQLQPRPDRRPAADVALQIRDFSLWYGATQALYDITMDVPRGKVTALIGPSGCGKSTLLRCVNRLNDLVDGVRIEGDMLLDGDSIYAPDVDVIELRKRMGMVFQSPTRSR